MQQSDKLGASEVKVIVVGAGASGLAAVSRLLEAGVASVTVLEASDRVGGRIHSDKFGDETVEMGAQWINGQGGNVIYKIADEDGLTLDPETNSFDDLCETFFDVKGDILDATDSDYIKKLAEAEEAVKNYPYKKDESVASYYDSFFANESVNKDAGMLSAIKDLIHRVVQLNDGCDSWKDLSIKGAVHDFKATEGNQHVSFKVPIELNRRPGHSYSEVLNRFLSTVNKDSNCLRLNSEVTKIKPNSCGGIKVVLTNEQELTADYVIVTVSLAVLKAKAGEMFDPALSDAKMEAIEKVGFGTIAKVYLRYETAWWPQDSEGFSFLFDNDGDTFNYSEAEAEADWTRFVLGIYRVINHPNLLQAWVSGAGARKMETLADEQIKADLHVLTTKFLGKAYPQLPQPLEIKASRWHSNPFVLGSWSYPTVSSAASDVGPADLARPEMDGRLLFAGEATHECYFSSTHGAVETGWREADRIINSLKQ